MKLKKWMALLLCFVLMLGMTGCIGHFYDDYALIIDDMEITPGLYMMALHTAYSSARQQVEDTEKDALKQSIDGQKVPDWMREQAEEELRTYVAVRKLCREKGITLDDQGNSSLQQMQQYWPYLKEMYAANGISLETYTRYYTYFELERQLFGALYAEGGELYVTDAELRREYANTHAHIRFLSIPVNSLNEELDVTDEVVAQVEALVPLLEGGKTLEEAAVEDLPAIYELLERDYDVSTAADGIGTSYIQYGQEDDQTYSPEFLATLEDQYIGDYGSYHMGSTILLYQKIVTFENDEAFTSMRGTVLDTLKYDEFNAYLKSIYDEYSIEWAFGAKWYFSPSKIKR